ncbi:hypothetical protein CANTEDRAFT_115135 [Yamadazyma tenuis ATCC 10573]|uniref:Uncharacterized protein n=1 Tax=Candida tenuis (strain ATCC 10573 / BCRC 21748 / CBS 615 / JCM 9827 / NBRC 10315 / NRRL Y-1498 / VKM Y-70) TaxID=590646 RepID=G3B7X2_CANTC|nr:uncharacterized protein CANTEDRAFT_115135 [Yamadazyma tenuis ATCC 10573]EGV61677.1 hypothetical protein CANTEDRAFT_115135 [Yamadazyma tenuis ATCC 10573]
MEGTTQAKSLEIKEWCLVNRALVSICFQKETRFMSRLGRDMEHWEHCTVVLVSVSGPSRKCGFDYYRCVGLTTTCVWAYGVIPYVRK